MLKTLDGFRPSPFSQGKIQNEYYYYHYYYFDIWKSTSIRAFGISYSEKKSEIFAGFPRSGQLGAIRTPNHEAIPCSLVPCDVCIPSQGGQGVSSV